MQINITQKREEPLLSRTMLKATLEFDKSTPPYTEIISLLAANLKADEKLVAIRHVYNSFGDRKAEIKAYVYKDEAKKQLIEPKKKEKKEFKAAEKK